MERYFKNKPHITNRPLWLATKAELGIGTVQRTLNCSSGASIDTLEAIAKILGVPPYKLLMPSAKMRAMLSIDDHEHEENSEELQRSPDRSDAD